MTTLEIVLLVLGIAIFALSFFVFGGASGQDLTEIREEVKAEVKNAVNEQMAEAGKQWEDALREKAEDAMNNTERELAKVSNEKIMAVNEYSDTVLAEIDKNHKEAMFLYDMLNDKHKSITGFSEKEEEHFDRTVGDAEEMISPAAETAASDFTTTEKSVRNNVEKMENSVLTGAKEAAASIPAASISAASIPAAPIPAASIPADGKKAAALAPVTSMPADRKKAAVASDSSYAPQNSAITSQMGISFMQDGNNNEQILQLHKQGKSNVAIAKELGLGVGEVKLVIDLFEGMKG